MYIVYSGGVDVKPPKAILTNKSRCLMDCFLLNTHIPLAKPPLTSSPAPARMARTARRVVLHPQSQDPCPRSLVQSSASIEREHGEHEPPLAKTFIMECNSLYLKEPYPGDGQLVLIPGQWSDSIELDQGIEETCEWQEIQGVANCWKMTDIYEQLLPLHPNLFTSRSYDPWTQFSLFEKPHGAISLEEFWSEFGAQFYHSSSSSSSGESRVLTTYQPVVYQWVLHLVSAVVFLHTNDIILGEINKESCLLATRSRSNRSTTTTTTTTTTTPSDATPIPTMLCLVSFWNACYTSKPHDSLLRGGSQCPCPLHVPAATAIGA